MMTRKLKMGLAALVLVGVSMFMLGMTAFASPLGLSPSGQLRLAPGECAYWTTNTGGPSGVAVTSGANCLNTHSFRLDATPYDGATFENYRAFLGQVGEFVNGPGGVGGGPFTKVGSAKNVYTNGIVVTVYQGPGTNDGSAEAFNDLIHGQYPWQ